MRISIFPEGYFSHKMAKWVPSTKPNEEIEFDEYVSSIKNRHWEDSVLNVRSKRWEKVQAPGITASGTFEYRNVKGLINHSGLIAIDIDSKDNDVISVDEISADPHIMCMHKSISDNGGYVAFVKIEKERHLDAFIGLENYFANKYHVIVDESCKDVSRYRFVSFDENIYYNPKSQIFKKYLPKKKLVPQKTYVYTDEDLGFIFEQIKDRGINICEEYSDWVKVGMAMANTYGEAGRDKFHFISSFSTKYNQDANNKSFDGFLKRRKNDNTIATFFYLCKQQGIKIKTAKTEKIVQVAVMRVKSSKKNGGLKDPREGAIKTLELEGIKREDSEDIVDQVLNLPSSEIENEKGDDLISDLKAFLTEYRMEFNQITRNVEVSGSVLDDRALNSIYIKAKEIVSQKVNKDLLFSVIDSDFTHEFNPFHRFFEKNKHLKPSGMFEELCNCILCDAKINDANVDNYLQVFLQKWLLSVIASMHGTYSVMVLVLLGAQNEGKTNFFRHLLPEMLLNYYAESKLDNGNDDHVLMTKKIIIMDDEFGGKSKQEAKKFKELTAKDTFSIRKPYGKFHEDLKRIAVLAGTSNENEIINDPTGNRRIIPINVILIDWDRFYAIDKTALWMELYWKWKEIGNGWMLTKQEINYLNMITVNNEVPSIEQEAILMFFQMPGSGGLTQMMSNTEILNYIETRTKLKISPVKLGVSLKKLGFTKKSKRIDGLPRNLYEMILKVTTNEDARF